MPSTKYNISHIFSITYPLHLGQLFGFSTFAVHVYSHRLHLYCMYFIMKKMMRIYKRSKWIRLGQVKSKVIISVLIRYIYATCVLLLLVIFVTPSFFFLFK